MLLSVIIPTCHRNDLLVLCLNRLAPGIQTLSNERYEVIVTDDGSKSTAEQLILKEYPWAKWVEGPRKGPASNRNNGALKANGEWLVFTDDDCLPDESWLSSFFEAIKGNTSVRVLEGKTICKNGYKSPMEYAPSNSTGGFLWSCNFGILKSDYEKLGGFDVKFPFPHLEDNDFKDRVDQLKLPILFVDTAVVDHPARRLSSGYKLGKYQESTWYYFQQKKGQKVFVFNLLKGVMMLHLSLIRKQKLSVDTFYALWLIVEEWATILYNFQSWNKKYPVSN